MDTNQIILFNLSCMSKHLLNCVDFNSLDIVIDKFQKYSNTWTLLSYQSLTDRLYCDTYGYHSYSNM
jgi:hypothetical protein